MIYNITISNKLVLIVNYYWLVQALSSEDIPLSFLIQAVQFNSGVLVRSTFRAQKMALFAKVIF